MDLKSLFNSLQDHAVPLNQAILFITDLTAGSLVQLATELGYSRSTIYRAIESGSPKADLRQAICLLIGFDPWLTPQLILKALRDAGMPLDRAAVMLAADRGVQLNEQQLRMLQSGLGSAEVRLSITHLLGVDPWDVDGVREINPQELLQVLKDAGVPIHKAVALLCELANTSVAAIANQAGCRRNSVYAAMRGEFAPPETLRMAMQDALKIDPWAVYTARKPRNWRKPSRDALGQDKRIG